MPRKNRIEQNGFYHIVNRSVTERIVFHDNDDFKKFLEITDEASEEYGFKVYSFILMDNHYHLLLKIINQNLSSSLQKINSRYSIYYNRKYKRIGPLWQGRFKSWYIYDAAYLQILVRYIEFNPIKAGITKSIGEYKWAMSSKNLQLKMLDFSLIENTNFNRELDEKELEQIDKLYHTKLETKDDKIIKKELLPLDKYFENHSKKEQAIFRALQDGYRATDIAKYLKISNSAITKTVKCYRRKKALFEELKNKGIFWSYSKNITYEESGENLLIEYTLKYGDFDDIGLCLELFGKKKIKKIWQISMVSDKSFIKTNLLIARVFLGMDVESDYFKEAKNARFEKLKLLVS